MVGVRPSRPSVHQFNAAKEKSLAAFLFCMNGESNSEERPAGSRAAASRGEEKQDVFLSDGGEPTQRRSGTRLSVVGRLPFITLLSEKMPLPLFVVPEEWLLLIATYLGNELMPS